MAQAVLYQTEFIQRFTFDTPRQLIAGDSWAEHCLSKAVFSRVLHAHI